MGCFAASSRARPSSPSRARGHPSRRRSDICARCRYRHRRRSHPADARCGTTSPRHTERRRCRPAPAPCPDRRSADAPREARWDRASDTARVIARPSSARLKIPQQQGAQRQSNATGNALLGVRERERHVEHAVREAPLVVVPRQHLHQRAFDDARLGRIVDRRQRIVVEVDPELVASCSCQECL